MSKFLTLILMLISVPANAHVKWFSDYNFQQAPLALTDLNQPLFWGLFALSLISLPLLIWLDVIGDKSELYRRCNQYFDRYSDDAPLIMRVTMGAVLLMSWQGGSMVAPEIHIPSAFWGWFQFLLALFLLFKETTILAGVGMLVLYFLGVSQEGAFHMLDYVVYPAVGIYLILTYLRNQTIKNFDLPILYSGLGFSLCWVAFEKMIYPFWGMSVLAKAPELTMGLPHDFFLLSAAFIEFTLGYLLIICLLHRPMAATITIVFFITTSFFGKTEVVGHTILHGALLVFIVKGPGRHYTAPIRFHRSLLVRNAFAVVNFVILFALLMIPYQKMASAKFVEAKAKSSMEHPRAVVLEGMPVPSVMLHATKDAMGGWNLHVMTENFTLMPATADRADSLSEGHAHIYVNGKKIGRIYGEHHYLALPKGTNEVKVTLNTNSHKDLEYQGKVIGSSVTLDEDREGSAEHNH